MDVSLTPAANKFLSELMAHGYTNPAEVVEIALERMAQADLEELESDNEKTWLRQEILVGLEAAERGDFSSYTLDELKAQARTRYENRCKR